MARREQTIISALKVLLFKTMGTGLGIMAALGIAFLFGAGPLMDAYFFARRLVSNLAALADRVFETVYVPGLVQLGKSSGLSAVLDATNRIERICFGVGIVACASAIVFAPAIVDLAGPGFEAEGRENAIYFLRLLLLTLPLAIVAGMTSATLTSLRAFALPVIAKLAPRAMVVLALLLVPLGAGLEWAVYGVIVGTVFTLVIVWRASKRLRKSADATPLASTKRIDAALLTSLAGGWQRNSAILVLSIYFVVIGLIDMAFASMAGVGAIAVLALSQRVSNAGAGQVSHSFSAVYYTNLSEQNQASRLDEFKIELSNSVRMSLFFIAPIGFLLAGMAHGIAQLILATGAFGQDAAALAGSVIAIFALATLVNTVVSCLQTANLAHPGFPHLTIALASVLVAILVRVVLIMFLLDDHGVIAVAWGALGGACAYLAVMSFTVRRVTKFILTTADMRAILAILAVGSIVAILSYFGTNTALSLDAHRLVKIMYLGVIAALLRASYIFALAAAGQKDAHDVLALPKKVLSRFL